MARIARSHAKPSSHGKRAAQRYCLRCDRQFWSEGAHHRLCQRCRQSIAASPSPVEEYSVVSLAERGIFDTASVGRQWYR